MCEGVEYLQGLAGSQEEDNDGSNIQCDSHVGPLILLLFSAWRVKHFGELKMW